MQIKNIPEIFKSDDTVYHYTTVETALNFILRGQKIRLSPRKNSIDPIENSEDWYSYSDGGHEASAPQDKDNAYKVKDLFKKRLSKTKQVCFCKNNEIKDEDKRNNLPIEKYGFLKPRMWDNYGHKYKGICLAFSRKELEKEAIRTKIIFDDLNYDSFYNISKQHKSIDVKGVKRVGVEKYYEQSLKKLEQRLFDKHLDYLGENEFRLCSFSGNDYDYLDISNALKGVFISNLGINQHLLSAFRQVTPAVILDEYMFIVNWRNKVNLTSFKLLFDIKRSVKIKIAEQSKCK